MMQLVETKEQIAALYLKMAPPLGACRPTPRRPPFGRVLIRPRANLATIALGTCGDLAVTLLASEPEVQYIALRNIDLILRKVPQILSQVRKLQQGGSEGGKERARE